MFDSASFPGKQKQGDTLNVNRSLKRPATVAEARFEGLEMETVLFDAIRRRCVQFLESTAGWLAQGVEDHRRQEWGCPCSRISPDAWCSSDYAVD
jgi:hypothetical protein